MNLSHDCSSCNSGGGERIKIIDYSRIQLDSSLLNPGHRQARSSSRCPSWQALGRQGRTVQPALHSLHFAQCHGLLAGPSSSPPAAYACWRRAKSAELCNFERNSCKCWRKSQLLVSCIELESFFFFFFPELICKFSLVLSVLMPDHKGGLWVLKCVFSKRTQSAVFCVCNCNGRQSYKIPSQEIVHISVFVKVYQQLWGQQTLHL